MQASIAFSGSGDQQAVPLIFRGDSHRLLPVTGVKEKLRRYWISIVYRWFDACLYVGKANFQYFVYHGVSPDRLFFSPHAVDNQRFLQAKEAKQAAAVWKAKLGIPKHHRVILFAGKFSDKKRPLDLLRAFLKAKLSEASLLFVGAGPLENQLKTEAELQLDVYFAPFQNQSYMPRTYAAGDIFVLPSYGSGETWGLAVNEAMCWAVRLL